MLTIIFPFCFNAMFPRTLHFPNHDAKLLNLKTMLEATSFSIKRFLFKYQCAHYYINSLYAKVIASFKYATVCIIRCTTVARYWPTLVHVNWNFSVNEVPFVGITKGVSMLLASSSARKGTVVSGNSRPSI